MKKSKLQKKEGEKRENNDVLPEKLVKLEEQLRRALADYDNFSKRVEGKRGEWEEMAAARVIDKLLDVYDDLCRAEKHLKDHGLTMAVNQFWAALESEGTAKIKTDGEDFNPETMDCVQVVEGGENKVTETITCGYRLKGKVIRPAKVKVGKGIAKREG